MNRGGGHNIPRFLCSHMSYYGPRVTYFIPRPTNILLFSRLDVYVILLCSRVVNHPSTGTFLGLERVRFSIPHTTRQTIQVVVNQGRSYNVGLTCTLFAFVVRVELICVILVEITSNIDICR